MRTSSASSKTSAIPRMRSASASQSRSTASKMNSSTRQRHPGLLRERRRRPTRRSPTGSRAPSCAGGAAQHLLGREPLLRELGALVRVLGRPDRDHPVDLLPDPLDRGRFAQDLERRLTGERAADLLERSCSIGYAPRRAICSITASISGRAAGCRGSQTCQPGWTSSDRSTSSLAYSSIRGSRRNRGFVPRRARQLDFRTTRAC